MCVYIYLCNWYCCSSQGVLFRHGNQPYLFWSFPSPLYNYRLNGKEKYCSWVSEVILYIYIFLKKRTLLLNPQLKLKKLHYQYLFWSSTKQHQPNQWMGFGFGSPMGVTLGQHTYPQLFETLCDHFTTFKWWQNKNDSS